MANHVEVDRTSLEGIATRLDAEIKYIMWSLAKPDERADDAFRQCVHFALTEIHADLLTHIKTG